MAEVITAYRCLECERVSDEHGGSLYECGQCSTLFTQETSADGGSNRCPNDNRFGAKIADMSCVECGEGEVEEVRAVEVEGKFVVLEGGLEPDVALAQALARREAERREEQERASAKERQQQERIAWVESLPRVRADEIRPGDLLAYHDPGASWLISDQVREYRVGRAGPDKEGKIRLAPPGGTGLNFVCDPGDAFALVERPEITPENEPSIEEQLAKHWQ